jgi:uncharacterized protein YecT (DUF1311 family)
MKLLIASALLLSLAGSAMADQPRPSQLACDTKKIGAKDLADCLRAAADRSDKELAGALAAAIKEIEARPGLLAAQKNRWKRSLNDSQSLWLNWRDADCQDVAPFEAGMSAKGGDPRLGCIIDHDAQRVDELKSRYSPNSGS